MTPRRPGILGRAFLALLPALAGAAQPRPDLPPFEPPTAHDRILVVAPHPDDETLCCAGLIRRALASGATVAVVWLTPGDAFELDALVEEHHLRLRGRGMQSLGRQRILEAHQAATRLGVAPEQQFMLGYPDRGLAALLGPNQQLPYRSAYTRRTTIPYDTALAPGSTYTGRNVERDLAGIIERLQPTLVFAPAPEERHPDHAAAGEFTRRVLAAGGRQQLLRYYLIHSGREWPRPHGLHPQLPLDPPPVAAARMWQSFALTDSEQQAMQDALAAHHSQMVVMRPFLEAFVRRNELFAR